MFVCSCLTMCTSVAPRELASASLCAQEDDTVRKGLSGGLELKHETDQKIPMITQDLLATKRRATFPL